MSKSTITTMEHDLQLLDFCIDMLKNPNCSSALVLETMCASLVILQERIKVLNSPVLSIDITEKEYDQYFKEVFIKYDVMRFKHFLLPDL